MIPAGATEVDAILAPGAGLTVILYALYLIVKTYREGRREQVLAARNDATKATQRADDAERERDKDLALLEKEIADVRRELVSQRHAHDEELASGREERERERARQTELLEAERRTWRGDMAAVRAACDRDIAEMWTRLTREIRVGHRLTEWCITHSIGLPPDLDPAHPEIMPDLDRGAARRNHDDD